MNKVYYQYIPTNKTKRKFALVTTREFETPEAKSRVDRLRLLQFMMDAIRP